MWEHTRTHIGGLKDNKGITLVALVITIIILIILAGISINMLLGEGGLITKAQQAKENIELAQIDEQEKLNELYRQFNIQAQGVGDSSSSQIAENAATEDKILKDYKAYVNGQLLIGTMKNNNNQTVVASTIEKSGDNLLVTIPENAYYDNTAKLSIPTDDIREEIGGSVSFNIVVASWDPGRDVNAYSAISISKSVFKSVKIDSINLRDGLIQFRNSNSTEIIDVSSGGTFNLSDYPQLGDNFYLAYGKRYNNPSGGDGTTFSVTLYY